LGKAIAELFAKYQNRLFLSAKNNESLDRTVKDLISRYPELEISSKAFDLGKSEGARALGDWVLEHESRVDVLVNNAGSFIPGNILDEAEGNLETLLQVNLGSAYHLSRKLLPAMMAQPIVKGTRGHIFNICSIASLQAYPQGGSYSISKFALAGFSKNLREELKQSAIKVTAVYPGAIFTDSWAGTVVDESRILEAADIAAMIYAACNLSPQAAVEEILIRPQLGDL
jgi:short-subunit dehydrogenase